MSATTVANTAPSLASLTAPNAAAGAKAHADPLFASLLTQIDHEGAASQTPLSAANAGADARQARESAHDRQDETSNGLAWEQSWIRLGSSATSPTATTTASRSPTHAARSLASDDASSAAAADPMAADVFDLSSLVAQIAAAATVPTASSAASTAAAKGDANAATSSSAATAGSSDRPGDIVALKLSDIGALVDPTAAANAANWDTSGNTSMKALLGSDPTLGFSGLQSRTDLAVAGALTKNLDAIFPAAYASAPTSSLSTARTTASGSLADVATSPAQWFSAATAGTAVSAASTSTLLASAQAGSPALPQPAAATGRETASGSAATKATGASNGAAPSRSASVVSTQGAANTTAASDAVSAPAASGEQANFSSASGEGAASGANSSIADKLAAAGPDAAAPAGSALTGVAPANLPNVLFDEASQFVAEPTSSSASPSATPAHGSTSVRQLSIALDPAGLGEISVKLKLTGDKLSVTIHVANADTLSALDSVRDAVAARLSGLSQPLESLVIQAQGSSSADVGSSASGSFQGSAPQDGAGQSSARSQTSNKSSPGETPRGAAANSDAIANLDDRIV